EPRAERELAADEDGLVGKDRRQLAEDQAVGEGRGSSEAGEEPAHDRALRARAPGGDEADHDEQGVDEDALRDGGEDAVVAGFGRRRLGEGADRGGEFGLEDDEERGDADLKEGERDQDQRRQADGRRRVGGNGGGGGRAAGGSRRDRRAHGLRST